MSFYWNLMLLNKNTFFLGKNLEYGLKQEGIITFVRELNGNEIESSYDKYLLDARMYARGKWLLIFKYFSLYLTSNHSDNFVCTRNTHPKVYVSSSRFRNDKWRICLLGCWDISGEFFLQKQKNKNKWKTVKNLHENQQVKSPHKIILKYVSNRISFSIIMLKVHVEDAMRYK